MIKITEKQIENSILSYLERIPGCLCYKKNNGAVYDKKKKTFRTSVSRFQPGGVSDIYGSLNGSAVFIEVKLPRELAYIIKHREMLLRYVGKDKKKNRYKSQIQFIEQNKKYGCIAFFADSVQMVKAELLRFYKETNDQG